jgi:hypothetical protein
LEWHFARADWNRIVQLEKDYEEIRWWIRRFAKVTGRCGSRFFQFVSRNTIEQIS